MMNWIVAHQKGIKHALLLTALLTFLLAVVSYSISRLFAPGFIPEQFIPSSLLGAITPAISVLLVYELLLLTLSVKGPFVIFIRRQFEVISLIVLRDLFKKMDELAVTDIIPAHLLVELAVVGVGSILLYFFVEVLERIESNFIKGALKEELPTKNSWLHSTKGWFEAGLFVFFTVIVAYEAVGWLAGVPGTGFNQAFLELTFSGLIIFNVTLLFLTLLATEGYEILFEHSALIVASLTVLIAISKDTLVAIPLIIAALLFVIVTLMLHGFARGRSISGQLKLLRSRDGSTK